jgi:hypothetical protein
MSVIQLNDPQTLLIGRRHGWLRRGIDGRYIPAAW